MNIEVNIRPYLDADWPIVFDAWWRAAWAQHKYEVGGGAPSIPMGSYKLGLRSRITHLLKAGQTLVATSTTSDEYVLGFVNWQCWAVGGEPLKCVHFIWTRGGKGGDGGFRRMGVAAQLLEHAGLGTGFRYSQHTGSMGRMRKVWKCEYSPFLREER